MYTNTRTETGKWRKRLSEISCLFFSEDTCIHMENEGSRCWPKRAIYLMQPVFCWKMVTKQTWNILFLTCSCLSRWTNQYCATARSSQAMPKHRKQNSGFVPKALSYSTIIMLLGICQALPQTSSSIASAPKCTARPCSSFIRWLILHDKQTIGRFGKLSIAWYQKSKPHLAKSVCRLIRQNGGSDVFHPCW